MNFVKPVFAAAVMALSAAASAQVVYVPHFPVKKAAPVQTAHAENQAPASEATAQNPVKSEKAA